MRPGVRLAAAVLAAAGLVPLASGAWIHAKALLAQQLIAGAWAHAGTGRAVRPWPWADMHPIARLTVPARHLELYVLDNASPRALAFGPGLVAGTAAPGSPGNVVLVAHRDTHFAFLRTLVPGEEIDLESPGGRRARYRVRGAEVVDRRHTSVLDDGGWPQLTLVTCYPFDALRPGTPLRYVVVADRVA